MTKKQPIKKLIKRKRFDLSMSKETDQPKIIEALESLQRDAGWQLLKQIFESNIDVLQAAIIKRVDPEDGKTTLSEDECDRLRDKLSYLEELLDKPNLIIAQLSRPASITPDYDPYAKVKQPVRNDP